MENNRKYEVISEHILKELETNQSLFSNNYYEDFKSRITKMKEKIENSKKEGRLLKIGIVGEVKAGKSSFLNALIFDGDDILPKASTPMTAALTKIVYSKRNEAEIVYYSKKDWESIEVYSENYDKEFDKKYEEYRKKIEEKNTKMQQVNNCNYNPPESEKPLSKDNYKKEYKSEFEKNISPKLVACKELTDLVNEKNENDILDKLGKKDTIQVDNLKIELEKYIGAEGKYTPIVKNVELRMNLEMLEGIEIVDTPGMNDPIISRGEKTKEFLGDCDVVFLLSYCGQFLSQEDISFMYDTLPREGVKEVIIIGSKFDSGVLDYTKTKDFFEAIRKSMKLYDNQASNNINQSLKNNQNNIILSKIKESLPPVYTSSILFNCAVKRRKNEKYSKDEEHIIGRLKNQFNTEEFDLNDYRKLYSLSGIGNVNEKLRKIKENKNNIINEKNKEIVSLEKGNLIEQLENINIEIRSNKNDLENYNKEELGEQSKDIISNLNSVRINIKNIFEKTIVEAQKVLKNIEINIHEKSTNSKYINVNIETETHKHKEELNTGLFSWTKVHYDVTTYTKKANISDAINNLKRYISECNKYVNDEFKSMINKDKLKKEIKNEIIKLFDVSNKNFDENKIILPVDTTIGRLQIPDIKINEKEFTNEVVDFFSGRGGAEGVVKGDDISLMEQKQVEILSKIYEKIKEEIEKCKNNVEKTFKIYSSEFVDTIETEVKDNTTKLKKQLDDKEKNIKQYEIFIENIKEYKKMIKDMEI